MSGVTLARCSNSSSAYSSACADAATCSAPSSPSLHPHAHDSADSVVRNGKQAINQFVTLCEQAVHLKDAVDTVQMALQQITATAEEQGHQLDQASVIDDSRLRFYFSLLTRER